MTEKHEDDEEYIRLFGLDRKRCNELREIATKLVMEVKTFPLEFITAIEERTDLTRRELIFIALITGKAVGSVKSSVETITSKRY